MREGWEYRKIKDICTFIGDGDWIESKDQSPSGIRLIQTGNVGNGIFKDKGDKAKYISEDTFKELSCTEIYEGDCLLSRLPEPIGRGCILPKLEERTITAVDCTILRFNITIIPQYFVYYTQSVPYSKSIDSKTTGTTRKRISRKNLENIEIPVPNKDEQLSIVSELDKINDLIRLKKEQLKDYDKLAQSIFYEMFGDPVENEKGWEVKKMSEICNSELGKMLDSKKNTGKLRPYLCTINVLWGQFDLSNIKEMRIEDEDLERYSVSKGDFLVCEGGDTGRCAIWNADSTIYYQNSLHRVRFDNRYMLPIVCQYIFEIYKKQGEIAKYSKGQTIKHLVKNALLSIPVPLPPLSLQQNFSSRIEAIERQKSEVQAEIKDLETLLASRMQYWFE